MDKLQPDDEDEGIVYFPPSRESIQAALDYANRMDAYVRSVYGSGIMYTYHDPLDVRDFAQFFRRTKDEVEGARPLPSNVDKLYTERLTVPDVRHPDIRPVEGIPFYDQKPQSAELQRVTKPWANYPVQGFIADISAKIGKAFAVDRELLGQIGRESTADAMTMTFKAAESYFDKIRDKIPMPTMEGWTIESWFIVYIRRRPCVFTCGFSPNGTYHEIGPKPFKHGRAARKWARRQVGQLIIEMVLKPPVPLNWTSIEIITEGQHD